MIYETFRTPNGFPTRIVQESGTYIENEFLFALYENMFTGTTSPMIYLYYTSARAAGFPNHIDPSVKEKEISHDQLTAYSCYSFEKNMDGHTVLYNSIRGLTYKALGQSRSLHPRDLIFYALLNRRPLGFILLPILYILCAASMFIGYRIKDGKIKAKLSGELLWVLRCHCVRKDRLLSLLLYPCRLMVQSGAKLRFGSIRSMVSRYFYDNPMHPILKKYKGVTF